MKSLGLSMGGENGSHRLMMLTEASELLMNEIVGPNHRFVRKMLGEVAAVIDEAATSTAAGLKDNLNGTHLKKNIDLMAFKSLQRVFVRIQSYEEAQGQEVFLEHEVREAPNLYERYLEAWKVAAVNEFQAGMVRVELEYVLEQGGMDSLMKGYIKGKTPLGDERFEELTKEMAERAEREGLPISMIFADLDSFKRFNDVFGHDAGDLALAHYGRIFRETLRRREGDVIFKRDGGEEVVICLYGAPAKVAAKNADHARETLQNIPVHLISSCEDEASLSIPAPAFVSDERFKKIQGGREFENIYYENARTGRRELAGRRLISDDERNPGQKVGLYILELRASVGVVELGTREPDQDMKTYFARGKAKADAQQKMAKEGGKNCVFVKGEKWEEGRQ